MSETVQTLSPPRALMAWERRTLEVLLGRPFPGATDLRAQIGVAAVAEEYPDGDPTVVLFVDRRAAPSAPVRHRIPSEGKAPDTDGVPIQVLVHVIDGYLSELEVFRVDGRAVLAVPEPSSLVLFSPGLDPV